MQSRRSSGRKRKRTGWIHRLNNNKGLLLLSLWLDIMKKQLEADRKELEKANAHQRNMDALKNAFLAALGVVSSGVMMGIAAGTAALGVITENPGILYLSAQIASHVLN